MMNQTEPAWYFYVSSLVMHLHVTKMWELSIKLWLILHRSINKAQLNFFLKVITNHSKENH
jgi:hypothetical protein